MKIRRASQADVDAIAQAYAGRAASDLVEMPAGSTWWVALDDSSAMVAFAGAERRDDELRLTGAWTEPSHRGNGLQVALIRARVRHARRLGCARVKTYVWGGNLPSMRALMRCGFVPTARHWDGERSWLYWSREVL